MDKAGGIQSKIAFFNNIGKSDDVQGATKSENKSGAEKSEPQVSSPSAGIKVSTEPKGQGLGAAKSDSVVQQWGTFKQGDSFQPSGNDRQISAKSLSVMKGSAKADAADSAGEAEKPAESKSPPQETAVKADSLRPRMNAMNKSLPAPPASQRPALQRTKAKIFSSQDLAGIKKSQGQIKADAAEEGANVEDLQKSEAKDEKSDVAPKPSAKDENSSQVPTFKLSRKLNDEEGIFAKRWQVRAQLAHQGTNSPTELKADKQRYLGMLKILQNEGKVGDDFANGIKSNISAAKGQNSKPLAKASYTAAKTSLKRQGNFFKRFNELNAKHKVIANKNGEVMDYTPKVKQMKSNFGKLVKKGRFITKRNAFSKIQSFDRLKAKSYDAIGLQIDEYKNAAAEAIKNKNNMTSDEAKKTDEYKKVSANGKIIHEFTDPDGKVNDKQYQDAFTAFEKAIDDILG